MNKFIVKPNLSVKEIISLDVNSYRTSVNSDLEDVFVNSAVSLGIPQHVARRKYKEFLDRDAYFSELMDWDWAFYY